MSPHVAKQNQASQNIQPGGTLTSGVLDVVGTTALLRVLPNIRTECERFLWMLRSRPVLTHVDAIEALWGERGNGGPLYAQHILAIYVSRLRRAGHLIENYRGIGYRLQQPVRKVSIGTSRAA